jgi:hypothetical protein
MRAYLRSSLITTIGEINHQVNVGLGDGHTPLFPHAHLLSVVSVLSSLNRICRVEGRRNERESAIFEARDGDGYLTRNWPMSVRSR